MRAAQGLAQHRLAPALTIDLQQRLGQLRAAPITLGAGQSKGLLLAFGADAEIDPSPNMFFYPTDTMKLAVVTADGEELWRRDLGRGVVPGLWFCPVLPCDLDGDGIDEVWYVDNRDPIHPLAASEYRLTRLDGRTGAVTGSWPWPQLEDYIPFYAAYRNFIIAGRDGDERVLVTAQGTYGQLRLQGWNQDLSQRWSWERPRGGSGSIGSHMAPVIDLTEDGRDCVAYGEHLIDIGTGQERFCCDEDSWLGHSDVVQPWRDRRNGEWSLFTCRENRDEVQPRVAVYGADGSRRWGALDHGHMDMGWVAHLPGFPTPTAYALRIGGKTRGPDGTQRQEREEFVFDVVDGSPRQLACSVYGSIPVDHDGDGLHALIRTSGPDAGDLFDADGRLLDRLGEDVALVGHILDQPGEQILTFHAAGRVSIWANPTAEDNACAEARYRDPFYQTTLRSQMVGYHLPLLGGL